MNRFLARLALGWLLLLSVNVFASTDDDDDASVMDDRARGIGGFFVKGAVISNWDLNQALSPLGAPMPTKSMVIIGGKGLGRHGDWYVGGGGAAIVGSRVRDGDLSTSRGGGYGGVIVKRTLARGLDWSLAAESLLGAGGAAVTVQGPDGKLGNLSESFFVFDPSLNFALIVSRHMQVEFEAGLFLPLALNSDTTLPSKKTADVINVGPTFGVNLLFGRF